MSEPTQINLQEVVQGVKEIPPLPTVATRVFHMLRDPRVTAKSVSDEIGMDQALAVQVLKLANSAYYSYVRKVSTLQEAVVILGMNTIRNLVLAASVQPTLNRSLEGYYMERGLLWKHSMAVALGAQILAKRKYPALVDNAFIAGLLHDLGKLVLDYYLRDTYQTIVDNVHAKRIPFMDAERLVLGFEHSEVGGKVAERWNLPLELVEAITLHHNPAEAKHCPELCAIVHVADITAMQMGIGLGGDGLLYPASAEAFELLGVDREDVEALASDMADALEDLPEVI